MTTTLTTKQIREWRNDAGQAGDLEMWALCELALGRDPKDEYWTSDQRAVLAALERRHGPLTQELALQLVEEVDEGNR